MGVYIKDMEMPKSCKKCKFCSDWGLCIVSDKWTPKEGKAPDCPLIPIPSYGRLIDANALEVVVEKHYKHYKISRYDRDLLLHYLDIEDAPTIIPASKEDET